MLVDIVHFLNPTNVACTLNIYQLSSEEKTLSSGCMYKVIGYNFASEVLINTSVFAHESSLLTLCPLRIYMSGGL